MPCENALFDWYGPNVMNTQEKVRDPLAELREGAFLKETARR